LPDIHREIAGLLHQANHDLSKFPEHNFDHPRDEVLGVLSDFGKELSSHIEGVPPDIDGAAPSLIYALNQEFEDLKDKIYQTAPQFRPWKKGLAQDEGLAKELSGNAALGDPAGGEGTIRYLDGIHEYALRRVWTQVCT
jgi:hypothetical protein